ncbi:MAG: response regulator transcription factor [Treponema sp.]|nr:response regulator transcription factor [Treponema sp.]
MNTVHTVLVVDDEEKILDIVKGYLEKEGCRALTAKTGDEALALFRGGAVSLVLLDLMLPGLSGETVCRKIRSLSDIPIIMMTAKVDEESIIAGLKMGADDYVTKPFSPRELMARVAAALRRLDRDKEPEARLLAAGGLVVDTETKRALLEGVELALTRSEFRLLALLMSRPEKIFTRDEIIDRIKQVNDNEYDSFDRTVDTHVKNLRQKLGDDPRSPRYIVTVYGMGYRFGVTA